MSTLTCPVCGKRFEAGATTVLPFCSARCRQIDLGRWLNEGYSVPVVRPDDEEQEVPPADEPDLQ